MVVIVQKVEEEEKECIHYWSIEASEGRESLGTCNYCFETRYFKNSIPGNVYNGPKVNEPASMRDE